MKKLFFSIAGIILVFFTVHCSTNPNKPTEAVTTLDRAQVVDSQTTLGLNKKGEAVTSRKVQLAEYLITLQKEVSLYEVDIYGSEELGRKGLYGALRTCLDKGGELKRLPEKSILTKNEQNLSGKLIIDENNQIVTVTEEYLLERIKRYENYRDSYEKQKEDYEERIRICETTRKQ